MKKTSKLPLITNLDRKLSDKEKYEAEKEEWNTHVVDEAVRQSEGYSYLGGMNPRTGPDGKKLNVITNDQKNWKAEDARKRWQAGKAVKPIYTIHHDDGEVTWVLTEADQEAVRLGYVCENCLEWQRVPNAPKCESVRGFSCNYRKRLY